MRKILLIVGIILLLLVGAGFWVVSNANSLIAGYKPQLEQMLSGVIKSPISLGEIQAQVFPEVQLKTENIRIGSPQGSQAEGLSLGKLALSVELLPLLSGQINATKLSLENPHLTFVKTAQGVVLEGLPKTQAGDAAETKKAEPQDSKSQSGESSSAMPAGLNLNLQQLSLVGGEIGFKDEVQGKTYKINQLNVDAQISLQGSKLQIGQAKIGLRALEQHDLMLLVQKSSFNLEQSALDIGQAELTTAFGKASLKGGYNLKDQSAKIDLQLKDLAYKLGEIDLNSGSGDIAFSAEKNSQRFASTNLKVNLNGEQLVIGLNGALNPETLKIRDFKLSGLGGELAGLADYALKTQEFSSEFKGSNFDMQKVLQVAKPGNALFKGTLEKLNVNLSGQNGAALKESMTGKVALSIKNGELLGINLAGTVLKAVKDIPLVSGALYSRVPAEYKAEVDSQNTPIREFSADFDIGQARLQTKNLKLLSTIFSLDAAGKIGFDSNIDLNSTIYFAPAFSQALTHGVKELSAILDKDKRLVLPLQISGQAPNLLILPDASKLLKLGAENLIRDKAGDLIDKALGGGGKKNGLGGLLGF